MAATHHIPNGCSRTQRCPNHGSYSHHGERCRHLDPHLQNDGAKNEASLHTRFIHTCMIEQASLHTRFIHTCMIEQMHFPHTTYMITTAIVVPNTASCHYWVYLSIHCFTIVSFQSFCRRFFTYSCRSLFGVRTSYPREDTPQAAHVSEQSSYAHRTFWTQSFLYRSLFRGSNQQFRHRWYIHRTFFAIVSLQISFQSSTAFLDRIPHGAQ